MKNLRALLLIVLALLIGLVAAAYARGWVAQRSAAPASKIVIAAVDIELGTRLTPQMLQTVEWPASATLSDTFADLGQLQERTVKVSVLRGEPLLERKLAPVGSQGGLSAVISSGKRAMTVRVNDVVGVAGFALPGNFVDVLVSTQEDLGKNEPPRQMSKTVLERVLVLAVAQEAGRDDTKPKVVNAVTLELSPGDSEKLDLARNVGTLSLVLRNQIDVEPTKTSGITKKQLLDEKGPAPLSPRIATQPVRKVAVAGPVPTCVEVVNGGRTVSCF